MDNGPNPENAAAATTEEVKKPAPAKTQEVIDNLANAAKTEEIKEPVAPQEPASTPAPANGNTDFAELEEKLAAFKDKGNNQFRKKAYKEAVKHFSEAIKLFEDVGRPLNHGDIKTKVT